MTIHRNWCVLAVVCVLAAFCIRSETSFATETTLLGSDKNQVQGRWIRFDAPYVIEITQNQNGKLQATYFNKKMINVEKTETAEKDGAFYIMVRLRDVNYQGSFYLLSYDRVSDSLLGTYFHAGSKQRFDVGFKRKK